MAILKKILTFIKNFLTGLLYPGLTAGLFMLIAAAMIYFQPFDYFSDKLLFPRNPNRPEMKLAWKLLKWGGELALACGAVLWLERKIESWITGWLKKRADKKAAAVAEAEAAPKEAA